MWAGDLDSGDLFETQPIPASAISGIGGQA